MIWIGILIGALLTFGVIMIWAHFRVKRDEAAAKEAFAPIIEAFENWAEDMEIANLKIQLAEALENEDYELAAKIRDKLNNEEGEEDSGLHR